MRETVSMKRIVALVIILSIGHTSFFRAEHFLSFIMPCYNCAATVVESLDSIYAQHNLKVPFEVICTDDGSTDSTRTVLCEYQKTHPTMQVYFHEQNKGGGASRNTCVLHSRGDIIFCLDSDNVLVPNSVQGLIDVLDQTGCDGASFAEFRFFRGNYEHDSSWYLQAPHNMCDLHHIITEVKTPGASGNYLYTRKSYDKAGGYPEGHPADTWGFGFRQHATGSSIALLPNSYYWHRFSDTSYWTREDKAGRMKPAYLKVVKEFPQIFTQATWEYLSSRNPDTYYIVHDLGNPCLQLINQEALDRFFKTFEYKK